MVVKRHLVSKGRVQTLHRTSRRPQGDRHDPIRKFIVLIKEGVEGDDGQFCDIIKNVEDVLYLQCQFSRHHSPFGPDLPFQPTRNQFSHSPPQAQQPELLSDASSPTLIQSKIQSQFLNPLINTFNSHLQAPDFDQYRPRTGL